MPHNVRMAYPTGANLNALLLQQLNFRTTGNYPISSLYTLYANGQGQTYWSNSVSASTYSQLSTANGDAIYSTYVQLSTLIYEIGSSSIAVELSTFEHYTYSSISTLFYYQAILLAESTNLNYAFLSTANSFQVQLNSYYQSTVDICYSTLDSLTGYSSFYGELDTLYSSFEFALSSMSTGIGLQDAITSTLLINLINTGLYSTSLWTAQQISSLATSTATTANLDVFSTSINYALLSTSAGLSGEIDATNAYITDVSTSVTDVNTALLSTSDSFFTTINTLSGEIEYLSTGFVSLSGEVSTFEFYTSTTISSLVSEVSFLSTATSVNTADIASLSLQVSVITTSSILEGIYSTFLQLEAYSVYIINSTEASTNYFLESTNTAYVAISQSTISGIEVEFKSTFSGVQLIQLDGTNFTASLDFVNYRNFKVQVNDIVDIVGSNYSITFDPTTLSTIALQQGVIMLDISTNTQSYTQNNNKLALNFNSWNIINTPTYSEFPMVADSAYKIEYIYSVYNNSVYTSLVNIWPYQNTYSLLVSSIDDNTGIAPAYENIYSTGTVLEIEWQMYLFSTFTSGFSSFVNVDIAIDGAPTKTFGPYSYIQSTVQIAMPDGGYPPGYGSVPATFKAYVVGEPANASIVNGFAYYP